MSTAIPNFKITGNPALDGLILKGIVALVAMIVTYASAHLKITDPDFVVYLTTALTGLLVGAATFIYGFVLSKVNQAKAVSAGINLTASGNAIADDGKIIEKNDNSTPPKPVTLQTAPVIVKNYAASTAK